MSSNTHKNQIQSLSSLSLEQNLKDLRDSQIFGNNPRKSSFDLINNIFKDSGNYNGRDLKNSLQFLNSNIDYNKIISSPGALLQLSQEDKAKIQMSGRQPLEIGQISSESDYYSDDSGLVDESDVKLEPYIQEHDENYKINQYLPLDLAKLLKEREIPLEYVKGLLLIKEQKEIKSLRRLKVQRYLEKRRKKTWSRKICYNCRQKVAEERLRIKGKFIKKRRAMEILGLTQPVGIVQLRRMLEKLLKNKNIEEIEEIIKKEEAL